jgi:hypothetical protein
MCLLGTFRNTDNQDGTILQQSVISNDPFYFVPECGSAVYSFREAAIIFEVPTSLYARSMQFATQNYPA